MESGSKKPNGGGIFLSLLGMLLIPFSLVLIWKNERKIVKCNEIMNKARTFVCKNVEEQFDDYELQLIHTV